MTAYLDGHYSQSYFVHRHLNNACYKKAHALMRKKYLVIIVNGDYMRFFPEDHNRYFTLFFFLQEGALNETKSSITLHY